MRTVSYIEFRRQLHFQPLASSILSAIRFNASVLQFPREHIKNYNRTLWAIRLSLRIVTLVVLPSFLVGAFAADSHVLGMTETPVQPCRFPFSDSAGLGSFTNSVSLAACHQGCANGLHQIIVLRHPAGPFVVVGSGYPQSGK